MLKIFLKSTFRNLIRHKVFSFINIFGLAAGMACTILILLWVQDELSYDNFHKDAERIHLVIRGDQNGMMAVTSKLLAPALKEELPETENSTYLVQLPETYKFLIQNGDLGFEEDVILAYSNFFRFFSFKFISGNPSSALSDPNSVVITQEIARKYFGKDDPLGRQLNINAIGTKSIVRVTGVIENIPPNSHIKSQIIFAERWFRSVGITHFDSWDQQSFRTYIKLKNSNSIESIPDKIKAIELKYFSNQNKENLKYSLLPLTDIRLYGSNILFLETGGSIEYVNIFTFAAIIILLIASMNYMNLSTALSLKRTKEIGIKKAVGAKRKALIFQFLNESLILSLLAVIISVFFIEIFLPEFNLLTGKNLKINYNLTFIGLLLLLGAVTSVLSGIYPAILLSSFNPVQILKGKLKVGSRSLFTRKGLVIFQFALSTIIIVCTIVIFNQLSFIRNSNPGFDKENLLCIRLIGDANRNFQVMKNDLLKNKAILNISRSMSFDAIGRSSGVNWRGNDPGTEKHFWIFHSDFESASVYKFEMKEGRFFSPEFSTDSTNAYVLNEAALKLMGLKSPLNEEINVWGKNGKIIGIAKNFNFSSFHSAIEPLIFRFPAANEESYAYTTILLRFRSIKPDELISFTEKIWKEHNPGTPFKYYFLDESLDAQYKSELRMNSVFNYFSFLSILLACLGLFGLASISAEQRIKEIGIRKVLGASITNLALVLSKEFILLVIISNIIAFPAAYYFMNDWLQDFAYRIDIAWWMFILAGAIALIIAIVTVSFQAIKAATANPVESLRYE